MLFLRTWLLALLSFCLYLPHLLAGPLQLVSTESDPDAFIQNSINVLNGEDCESATDLLITGPDALVLQRFYSTNDAITGTQVGGWRILPQRFLVVGKDPSKKTSTLDQEPLELALAFTGERSGGILPYSGWRRTDGSTKEPLQIDLLDQARGAVNTYAKEIQGQNNKKNARLHCQGETCELYVGDGSKRTYKRVNSLPSQLLGEELTPIMAAQVLDPSYYLLVQEILPSGNTLFFSYDPAGHLTNVEMKNPGGKLLSWIRFSYLG